MLELKKLFKLNRDFVKTVLATIIFGTALSIGIIFVRAYSPPTAPPPGGNISAPINVGPATQTKSGGLNINGNVGIGTTAPTYKLGIADDNAFGTIIDLKNTGPGQQSGIRFLNAANNAFVTILANDVASPTRSLRINAFGSSDSLVIRDNGVIGIGSDSLVIYGGSIYVGKSLDMNNNNIANVNDIRVRSVSAKYLSAGSLIGGGDIAAGYIYEPSGGKVTLGSADVGGAWGAKVSGELEVVRTSSDGNVLKLQDIDGTCNANPESGSVIWSCSSDVRLKTNITDAKAALPDLMKLKVREYTITSSGKRRTGVIAQEVQEVMPELVSIDENGYLTVSEVNSWKLIQAIKELKTENDGLKARIEVLEANIGK